MKREKEKIIIGFIAYNGLTAKYLPYFLDSLKKQTYKNYKIIVVDNSEDNDNDNEKIIKKDYPEIEYAWSGENIGFARAHNEVIRRAVKSDAGYALLLNPDMVLEPDFVEKMVFATDADKRVGAVAANIHYWDFKDNKKTDIIDSHGLSITREHRFSDIDQGKKDDGSDNKTRDVFGFTGAAVLLNINAMRDVAYREDGGEEYFDELMFMYKEDCDLSYRLRLAGWKIIFAPRAVIYHHRTASPGGKSNFKIALNRKNKSSQIKKWSFLNHWILLLKLGNLKFSYFVKLATCWYQIKSLVFIILFERYLLKELLTLWKLRDKIKRKRDKIKIAVGIGEIEKFMVNTRKESE